MGAGEIPAIGFVAPSGSGKTTLLRKLVPMLRQRGLRIGYLKHAHHGFALDRPGKDSYEVAAAGARQVMLVSGEHWALLSRSNERAEDHPAGLDTLRSRFDAGSLDLLLIEGFRSAAVPKIEVFRAATGKMPLYPEDDGICAVVTDDPLPVEPYPRVLPLSDPQALADFIGQLVRDSAGLPTDPRASLIDSLQPVRVASQSTALIGSASVRQGDRFWITPNNALRDALGPDALGPDALGPEELIACALGAPAPLDAALDASIHCEVYRQQPDIGALFQTKGPYSMALGLIGRQVEPLDDDGARLLGRVSVIAVEPIEHPAEASARVAETLAASAACIVARHGAYLAGATVREVHRRALALEHSAQIILLARAANAG